ncbi:MAG: PulJ/GspJ family protein [Planctomycetota bacterium]
MNRRNYSSRSLPVQSAFSLVEIVVVLGITAMIMLASFTIYGRVRASTVAVNATLDRNVIPTEILQRIAEDLDRLASPGLGTKITFANRFDSSGYNIARLVIQNTVYGEKNKPRIFEKIIWQTYYDYFEDALILYRSHNGINLEDKVITDDAQLELKEMNADYFIPLCSGITFFKIQVPVIKVFGENVKLPGRDEVWPEEEEKFIDRWVTDKLPKAVTVSISFAEPYQAVTGELEVLDSEKVTRTIAIDRTRNIEYRFVSKDFGLEDANDVDSSGQAHAGDTANDGPPIDKS